MTENSRIILRPWAKINLFLKILSKRSDGYHELSTFIHPIALFDEISIKARKIPGLEVNCGTDGLPSEQDVLLSKDNLVTKAVKLFFENIGQKPSVDINIIKRIPIGGGLGGGSSDAANTINGLNKLFGNPLKPEALYNICMSLGMDVAFFLDSRPALCGGRGEIIEKRFKPVKFWCILLNPGKSLSTQLVYKTLNLALTEQKTMDNIFNLSNLPRILRKVQSQGMGDALDTFVNIGNDLESPAVKLCPEIGYGLDILRRAGAKKSIVCGSGSTVCGLVNSKLEAEEVIERIRKEMSQRWWMRVVSSL